MSRPNSHWNCPQCGGLVNFDDDYFEARNMQEPHHHTERIMGMISVTLAGSFGSTRTKQFTAMKVGHAQAIADVIKYLVEVEMPKAIKNDHECQKDGIEPSDGFGGLGLLDKTKAEPT